MNSQSTLKTLSDKELVISLKALGRKENEATAQILLHLGELEARKLVISLGASSLFDYCTRVLRYSEGAAQRRIIAARAVAKYPELLALLLRKEITLCTLALAAGVLREDNKDEIISKITNCSRREAEAALSIYKTKPSKPREFIRAVACKAEVKEELFLQLLQITHLSPQQPENNQQATATGGGDSPAPKAQHTQATEKIARLTEFKFSVSDKVFHRYQQAAALLTGKYPHGPKIEEVLDELLECYLEKHSPERRQARRVKRASKTKHTPQNRSVKFGRAIPQALRDRVSLRDGGRCTYVGSDSTRCTSRHDLEIHHRVPFSCGGEHDIENLTILCRVHNLHQAELDFGNGTMRRYRCS